MQLITGLSLLWAPGEAFLGFASLWSKPQPSSGAQEVAWCRDSESFSYCYFGHRASFIKWMSLITGKL